MRNNLKKMAELTYTELIQGQESTHLPHMHRFTSLKNAELMLHTKIWYLSVSALFIFTYENV